MSISVPHDKQRLPKIKYDVRASQAIVQYSVGSMVDFPDQTLMPAAPEQWEDSVTRIHDERLERLLRVDYFGMPGSKDVKQFADGISYVRFPEWYFCPKCRRLKPLKDWIKEYRKLSPKYADNDPYMVKRLNCPKCHLGLVVARIVTVCENGHIDDFPWVQWAHARSKKPICNLPQMKLLTSPTSAEGLEGIAVSCENCGARSTLAGAFSPNSLEVLDKATGGQYNCHCQGRHPWKNLKEACGLHPRVVQRGASSVYYPVIESSLVIPPFSSKDTLAIESCDKFKELLTSIDSAVDTLNSMGLLTPETKGKLINDNIKKFANPIAAYTLIPEDQVIKILERKLLQNGEEHEDEAEEKSTISTSYKIEEFEALGAETPHAPKDGDFHKEIVDISEYDLPYVKSISLIHKIREVEAMIGYTRIKPASREIGAKNEPIIVSIKEPETKWYPAYEIRGEGIFIEFDDNKLLDWIASMPVVRERAKHIDEAYRASTQSPIKKTAKYIILHTLSHLLIKQLSFECGYGISSLKERIYCSEKADGKEMAAIFIYTANGDSEGTLGGLVRQGRSDCFPSLFKKALEAAMICSNDPVCSMSKGQGRDSINLAACYSCALIPETSCEKGNLCLDRGVLVGTFADHDIGLYSPYLYGQKPWKQEIRPQQVVPKPDSQSIPEAKKPTVTLTIDAPGVDNRASSYSKIWNEYENFAEHESIKAIYRALLDRSSEFDSYEKPFKDTSFIVNETGDMIQCDLRWDKAKVLFFSEYGDEDYSVAKGSDWYCITVRDGLSIADELISKLKGVK